MYRRFVIVVAALLTFVSPFVYADSQSSLTLNDSQVSLIRANCTSAQATLNRIHTSDALARVHLGQEYEILSTKLMAPMNSRVALNKLDGVAMTQTTVDFNNKLAEFRSLYQQYEQTTLKAIQMNCVDQPVSFYDTVALARLHRAAVRDSVVSLAGLVQQYATQVNTLEASVEATP